MNKPMNKNIRDEIQELIEEYSYAYKRVDRILKDHYDIIQDQTNQIVRPRGGGRVKLKPCPFCGFTEEELKTLYKNINQNWDLYRPKVLKQDSFGSLPFWVVICQNCGASSPTIVNNYKLSDAEQIEEVSALWNQRGENP